MDDLKNTKNKVSSIENYLVKSDEYAKPVEDKNKLENNDDLIESQLNVINDESINKDPYCLTDSDKKVLIICGLIIVIPIIIGFIISIFS